MGVTTFAAEAIADFQSTASIVPSSRFLAEAMVQPLRLQRAKVVVEFGPGTGAMTRRILHSLPADGRLIAFEVNPRFVDYLGQRIRDPRLTVLERPAEQCAQALRDMDLPPADAALSSLGLSLVPDSTCNAILGGVRDVLGPHAVFTQFQYVSRMKMVNGRAEHFDASRLINRFFPVVRRRMILRNIPPAFVYACSDEL